MVNDLLIVFILWMGLKSAESSVLKGWSLHRQFGQNAGREQPLRESVWSPYGDLSKMAEHAVGCFGC